MALALRKHMASMQKKEEEIRYKEANVINEKCVPEEGREGKREGVGGWMGREEWRWGGGEGERKGGDRNTERRRAREGRQAS